jgi:hypothetical protein
MSNEQLSTKVALLEQGQKTNEQIHLTMMENIKELKEDNKEIKVSMQGIEVSIAGLPELLAEKFDERYASKEYENSLKKLNWLVISAVVLALLGLIIKSQ